MKQITIISHDDDYFARDALMGEIEHHRKDVVFVEDKSASGVIVIFGVNLLESGQAGAIQYDKKKPMLAIVTHKENEEKAQLIMPQAKLWDWKIIRDFIDSL